MLNCIGVLRYVAGRTTIEWMIIELCQQHRETVPLPKGAV
jgi:hypothetical protein